VLAGRDFMRGDTDGKESVMLINQSMARELAPGRNPIGLTVLANRERRIIGVVGDVRHLALESKAGWEMYLPMLQTDDYSSTDLVVRAKLPTGVLASEVRTALQPIQPNLSVNEFRPLDRLVDRAASPRRFLVTLVGGFAALAMILASLGIYS